MQLTNLDQGMNSFTFIGMAGSGKSTLARALSKKIEENFVDTDILIESKFKQSLEELKNSKGYKFVRLAEESVILNLKNNVAIISTGGSAIYSEKSMNHLKEFSKIIYISVPLNIIKNRIGGGQKRGLAVPEGTSIEDAFNERKPMYEKWAQITIDGTLSVDELVNLIISEN